MHIERGKMSKGAGSIDPPPNRASLVYAFSSRVKTRRGVSGPKMDLLCEPDVSGKKEDVGPPVFPWTWCESLSCISWQSASKEITKCTQSASLGPSVNNLDLLWLEAVLYTPWTYCHRRSEGGTVTGGPREAI